MSRSHPVAARFQQSWDERCVLTVDDEVLSYGDLWTTAANLAENWRQQGYQVGDVIAFRLANSFRVPAAYLACAIGGFVACPVVPTLKRDTMLANLEDVNPVVLFDGELDCPLHHAANQEPEQVSLDGQRPFLIMFSSGSTGKSKAICHSLDNVSGSAAAFASQSGFNPDTKLYHVLPMTYMAGFLNSMLAVFMAGGSIVEGPQFSMETVADFWRRPLATDANVLSVIPPLAAAVCRLTRNQETIKQVAEQFHQVQCTSQSIQQDLRRRFLSKFSLPMQDCYGMTELGGPLSLQETADAAELRNDSHPLPELDIDLRDDNELWIRSPWTMLGYLKDGKLTGISDSEGFLDTGDVAALVNGRLEITGRVKDIIIRGGINTSPARIESVMSEIDGISEVSVVGVPHSFWGEEIVACVVGDGTEADILTRCRESLDSHEIPDRLVFMEDLPRSFIGKVLKRELTSQVSGHG